MTARNFDQIYHSAARVVMGEMPGTVPERGATKEIAFVG